MSPRAAAVQRGDRVRLAEPEVPQPVGLGLGRAGRRPCWRPARPACRTRAGSRTTASSVVGDADRRVDDEQHRVGQRRPRSRPGRAICGRQPAGVGVPAAGVDDGEARGRSSRRRRTPGRGSRPGTSSTTASRRPMIRLTSVDLPTLGRPTTASTGTGPALSPSSPPSVLVEARSNSLIAGPPRRADQARGSASTVSSRVRCDESTTVTPSPASGERRRRWSPTRRGRPRGRGSPRSPSASSLPCTSSARRASRAASDAVSSTLTSASGATTVVMSRPSTTMPPVGGELALPPHQLGAHARGWWRRRSPRPRCRGVADRLGDVPTVDGDVLGSRGRCRARAAAHGPARRPAAGSARSTPATSAHQVSARYMAPVSRKRRPSRLATPRDTLDLPEPDGPSIGDDQTSPGGRAGGVVAGRGHAGPRQVKGVGTPDATRPRRARPSRGLRSAATRPASAPGVTASSTRPTGCPGECSMRHVLDVDPGLPDVDHEPGQLARAVGQHHRHRGVRRRAGRRACPAAGPGPRCRGRRTSRSEVRAHSASSVTSASAAIDRVDVLPQLGEDPGDRLRRWRPGCRPRGPGRRRRPG